ncbi:MAG: hypothetical protein MI674_05270 [Cytophagales bacterium]|nr:hypothetical protein [Cytophagales bacterium]
MNIDKLSTHINVLEDSLKQLLEVHKAQKKQIQNLLEENQQLKQLVSQRDKTLQDFRNTFKISTIAKKMIKKGEGGVDVRKRINEYIQDIDKCIAHFESLK